MTTEVNPIGLPNQLEANACMVIQYGYGVYMAQLAFSFGNNKIAIRRKVHTNEWSDWGYFIASQ